jgi:hypothetical protein
MEQTGKIIAVMPANGGTSQRTGQTWMSQQYVLEVPGMYPKRMVFEVFGEDRIKKFNVQQGQEVTVSFEIDAHEFNGRWFNDVRAYSVVRGAAPVAAPAQGAPFASQAATQQDAASPFPPAPETVGEGSADDLPF